MVVVTRENSTTEPIGSECYAQIVGEEELQDAFSN